MITLLTASPGCGKSALAVKMIQDAIAEGRPVIQTGITDLVLPHDPAPPLADWTEQRESPDDPSIQLSYYRFPKNAFVVLDECQRFFRVRNSASKVPSHVEALETHRHTGIDMLLITQHPGLIDTNVRKLVGRHIHLRNSFLGRKWYEWEQICDDPHERYKSAPVKQPYKLPKSIFSLYSSAVLHTKPKRSFPPFFKWLLVGLPILIVGFWYASHRWHEMTTRKTPAALTASAPSSTSAVDASATPKSVGGASIITDFLPAHPAHPESAAAYTDLRKVVAMPTIVGCVEVKHGPCTCYTQQSTKVDMPDSMCHDMLHSPPFNPYYVKADKPETPSTLQTKQEQASAFSRIDGPVSVPSDVPLADPYMRGIKASVSSVTPVSG